MSHTGAPLLNAPLRGRGRAAALATALASVAITAPFVGFRQVLMDISLAVAVALVPLFASTRMAALIGPTLLITRKHSALLSIGRHAHERGGMTRLILFGKPGRLLERSTLPLRQADASPSFLTSWERADAQEHSDGSQRHTDR